MPPKRKRANGLVDGGSPPRNAETPASDSEVTQPAPVTFADHPFRIEYLDSPSSKPKKRRKSKAQDDHTPGQLESDVAAGDKPIAYIIRPGSMWEAMKKYRNFIVGEKTFGVHDFVYINHGSVDEKIIPQNFWIARVLEVRAADPQHVFLRVFWMYWPDDLPGGRLSYHGQNELVASNFMEIVDATTVSDGANVVHWNEEGSAPSGEVSFWRQTFDYVVTKLLPLRRNCICERFRNPDKEIVVCTNPNCGKQLHEECIIDDALRKVYERLATVKVNGNKNGVEVKQTSKASKRKSKHRKSSIDSEPWDGQFEAHLEIQEGEPKTGKIVITDLRDEKPTTWDQEIKCLACHEAIL